MSAEYHRLATRYMEDADIARATEDPVGEAAACVLAAECEQQAIDSLIAAGLAPDRPKTLTILRRSRDALNARAAKALGK